MIGNKCYNFPQTSNYNRKQIEESTSRFLLLIDKQLTNTCGMVLSAFVNHCEGLLSTASPKKNVRKANMLSVIRSQ